MTTLENLVRTPLAKALGWTLFHSLWEGAIVALLLFAALGAIRSARARYVSACIAMLTVLVAFAVTFFRLLPGSAGTAAAMVRAIPPAPPDGREWLPYLSAHLFAEDVLPWLSPFWIAGVILFHLSSFGSWIAARRLRGRGVCRAPDRWQERLIELGKRMRVSPQVELLESCFAGVPLAIGYLRPAILVPIGFLAGMPASQAEAILLHELAHIRRRDYPVNLMQTVVEGFLFYHPAIWWISGTIRAERENCCDDLAVATSGDPRDYAAALTALEQNRWAAHEAALAATGGSLMQRIRRLLNPLERPRAPLTPVFSAGILTVAAALALTAWQSTPPPAAQQNSWQSWVNEDVTYIITAEERSAFQALNTDDERRQFAAQFWERRNPTPGAAENPFKEEHYRRIAYANGRFTSRSGVPGWKTDRGRIYITFGPPDEIDAHPSGNGTTTLPFEDWRYRFIEGIGNEVSMEFVDASRTGEYRMTMDPAETDPLKKDAIGH